MTNQINLFLVGTGSVGSELLKKLKYSSLIQMEDSTIKINLVGIANRSKMYFNKRGIDLSRWKLLLENYGLNSEPSFFISFINELNLPNSVFVDCTDGEAISKYYLKIIKHASIVTSNKTFNAGKWNNYRKIREEAKKHGTCFRYSANVGVGLPSIDLIHSIIDGGDKIYSIEGLFSSTMNYLFDKLMTTNKKFSKLLAEAKENGLTEPDPRNDLNGIDTAKKILILVREAGISLEFEDIKIENLIPRELQNSAPLNEFMNRIKCYDKKFDRLKRKAKQKNCKLVYAASYTNGRASVKIQMVDSLHPFFSTSAKEKILLIRSKFYSKSPLIIIGSSGGVKATATVLISDILKIFKAHRLN